MSHGGAREGSGRPTKYVDSEGNKVTTRLVRIPDTITEEELQEFIQEKLKPKQ